MRLEHDGVCNQSLIWQRAQVIRDLKAAKTPLVIDADGLYIVTKDLDLVKGYRECIMTPNKNEFQRLADQLGLDTSKEGEQVRHALCLLPYCKAAGSWA